ncbi:hypothetical protein [Vulcanococcus sp.]|uniref:hypothetical protein n=1 Tax=Vulcanococcus sp. TaxID=2856995 RepID=UPI003C0915E5
MVIGWLEMDGTKVLEARLENDSPVWEPLGLRDSTAERLLSACADVWYDVGGNCKPACAVVMDLALEMLALDLDLDAVKP